MAKNTLLVRGVGICLRKQRSGRVTWNAHCCLLRGGGSLKSPQNGKGNKRMAPCQMTGCQISAAGLVAQFSYGYMQPFLRFIASAAKMQRFEWRSVGNKQCSDSAICFEIDFTNTVIFCRIEHREVVIYIYDVE